MTPRTLRAHRVEAAGQTYIPQNATLLVRISDARDILDEDGNPVEDTHGVDRQIKNGQRYAEGLGWKIGFVRIENDTSAFKRKRVQRPDGRYEYRTIRPVWTAILHALEDGDTDGFIVIDLDRAMRQPRDLEDLIDIVEFSSPRVRVESVTASSLKLGNDNEIMMARFLVNTANKASKDTSRRVKDHRLDCAETGRFGGGTRPYGFGVATGGRDGRGHPQLDMAKQVPAEAAIVAMATERVLAGDSLRSIVATLKEDGVATATGGQGWTPQILRQILMRPRNAGLVVHQGEIMEGVVLAGVDEDHPPIVSRDQWEACLAILTSEQRRSSRGTSPRWLGSGIYRCGHPDCVNVAPRPTLRVSGGQRGRAQGGAYVCVTSAHLTRGAVVLDEFVTKHLTGLLATSEAVRFLRPVTTVDVTALRTEAISLQGRMDSATAFWKDGMWDDVQYRNEFRDLKAKHDRVTAKIKGAHGVDPLADIAGQPDAAKIWETYPLARQRAILSDLLTVTVNESPKGRPAGWVSGPYFHADSIDIQLNR